MAEKKGVGHAYNVDFLNVVFAASSLFLFLSVVWMVWDDYDRDWKNTQRRFAQLEYQVTQAQLQQAARSVDRNKIAQLAGAAEGGRAERRARTRRRSTSCRRSSTTPTTTLYRATLDYNYMKATYDQDRYDFEAARAGEPNSASTARSRRPSTRRRSSSTSSNLALEKATADKGERSEAARTVHRPSRDRRRSRSTTCAPSRSGCRSAST